MSGPEAAYVIEALDALLRGEPAAARRSLDLGARRLGWTALAHRLAVVGRALMIDADLDPDAAEVRLDLGGDGDDDGVPGRPSIVVDIRPEITSSLPDEWFENDPVDSDADEVWDAALRVAGLLSRAGLPAEVVA